MRDVGLGDKVYSPDLQTFELEGPSGVFGTLASILVGPIRLLLRVMHNIMILPANLLASYADGLFVVGALMLGAGVFDFIVYHKWPLLVSQIPVMILAIKLKAGASKAVASSLEKTEVEIDVEQVEELCNSITDELDAIVGKESDSNEH